VLTFLSITVIQHQIRLFENVLDTTEQFPVHVWLQTKGQDIQP